MLEQTTKLYWDIDENRSLLQQRYDFEGVYRRVEEFLEMCNPVPDDEDLVFIRYWTEGIDDGWEVKAGKFKAELRKWFAWVIEYHDGSVRDGIFDEELDAIHIHEEDNEYDTHDYFQPTLIMNDGDGESVYFDISLRNDKGDVIDRLQVIRRAYKERSHRKYRSDWYATPLTDEERAAAVKELKEHNKK